MGESDRYQEYKHLRKKGFLLGSDNNALMALFILNSIFFMILLTMQVVYFFYEQTPAVFQNDILQWFQLPSGLSSLSERPWTILTYMFSDTGNSVMRILSNMLWLWAFGYLLQDMTGNDKIMPIYIYGGVLGGLFFIGAHYLIPPIQADINHASLIGANAATMAVATATTYLNPDHRFFTQIRKGIPIWVLLTVYIIIDFAGVASLSAAYSLSHLGGALAGFIYIYLLRKGTDAGVWMNKSYQWVINVFSPKQITNKEDIKKKVFYKTGDKNPFSKSSLVNQKRVDEILDKINSEGYDFLTEEEKLILKKASEDDSIK